MLLIFFLQSVKVAKPSRPAPPAPASVHAGPPPAPPPPPPPHGTGRRKLPQVNHASMKSKGSVSSPDEQKSPLSKLMAEVQEFDSRLLSSKSGSFQSEHDR